MKSCISLLMNTSLRLLLDSYSISPASVSLYLLRLIVGILGIKLGRLRSIMGASSIGNGQLVI